MNRIGPIRNNEKVVSRKTTLLLPRLFYRGVGSSTATPVVKAKET